MVTTLHDWRKVRRAELAARFDVWRKIRLPKIVARADAWRKACVLEVAARCGAWRQSVVAVVAGLWYRIDPRFRTRELRALAGGLALGVVLASVSTLTEQRYHTVAFPKPALSSIPWAERVEDFSGKLRQAFRLEPDAAREFADWILEAADRQRLEPELIASLVQVESSFRKSVRSYAGAVGPAQVQPRYWTDFCGGDDLSDPRFNIHCGAQVLAHLKELCGAGECALSAYNIGRNSSRKQAGQRFVSKVDYHFLQLKTL